MDRSTRAVAVAVALAAGACARPPGVAETGDAGDAGPPPRAVSLELRDAPVQQVLDAVSRGAELPLVVDPDAQVLVACARMTVLSGRPVSGDELFVLIAEALAPAALNLSRASTGGWIVRRNPGVPPPDSCAAGAAAAPTFDPGPPGDAGLPADASATARIIAGIRRISDTELEVTAASRDLFLASGGSSGRFIPVMRDGGAAGMRMFGLRKDGVLAALGLKNGDTLLSVNGLPIAGPDQALEVYAKARRAERVVLQIERDGKPMEIVVRIVPALGKGPAKR